MIDAYFFAKIQKKLVLLQKKSHIMKLRVIFSKITLILMLSLAATVNSSCEKDENTDPGRRDPIIPPVNPIYVEPEIVSEAGFSGGAVLSAFSVGEGRQVMFSRGNLQYQPSTGSWRFAGNQFDTVGRYNAYASETYQGWIDLFGWGTSGYAGCMPYTITTNCDDYAPNHTDISHTDYDWGVPNAIIRGGDRSEMWRTLTYDEWEYIIYKRPNAIYLHGQATVMGVGGYLLMPDIWDCPDDVHFAPDAPDRYTNTYNRQQWIRLQQLGVVFLPAAGVRDGKNVNAVGQFGYYWTSKAANRSLSYCVNIYNNIPADLNTAYRYLGHSVRLVKDIN